MTEQEEYEAEFGVIPDPSKNTGGNDDMEELKKIPREGKASMNKLNDLHGMQIEYFMQLIESGETLSSGELAAMNTALKQNDITVDITAVNKQFNMSDKLKEIQEKRNKELQQEV